MKRFEFSFYFIKTRIVLQIDTFFDRYCSMQLSTKANQIFKIEIKQFRLQTKDPQTNICKDFLRLGDGVGQNNKEITKMCGRLDGLQRRTWFSFTNNLALAFSTDHISQYEGFEILVTAVPKPASKTTFDSGMSDHNSQKD